MKIIILYFAILTLSLVSVAAPQTKSIEGRNLFSGTNVQVDSAGKKGLIVAFLSAKCPCSNSHNVELRELAQIYKDFKFVAVHSNYDEDENLSKPYFEKANFPFLVIEDDQAKIADRLQALKTPHVFVFSPAGVPLYQGGVSNSKDCAKADRKFLREALEDLQADKPIRTPESRTLGCAIPRAGEKNVW